MRKKKSRYKHSQGKACIEARVKDPRQLFDARDPSPFRERDLDDDFVEYITSFSKEFSFSKELKIIIYIDQVETEDLATSSIVEGIREFFKYKIDLQRGELKRFLRRAQIYLLMGIVILIACILGAQSISIESGPLYIFKEGLVIFGWVSMWKPIELMLFDWQPLYENIKLYKKLSNTEIDIKFLQTA